MKRFLAFLCVLAMVLSIVPAAAFAATQDVQAIIDAGAEEIIVLEADASNITVSRDTTIDLNGHNLDGVTVLAGTLYLLDSATADYTVADGVYGRVTNVTGAVKAAEGYLQVGDSFHAVNLDIYAMTLRAADVGVYYKSNFAADEIVAAQVESFGVALSVVTAPNAENLNSYCGYSAFTGFEAGEGANSVGTSTLLKGIMKPANGDNKNAKNAAMPVYGRAYIKTAEGYFFGETVKRSLQEQVEAIDGIWAGLKDTQKAPVLSMLEGFTSVMEGWNIPNILGGEAGEGAGEITVPVEVTTENGVVTEATTVEQGAISITVPTGTKLAEGAVKLTLTVTPKEVSDAGLTLEESQVLMPMDVHVDGLAADNAEPLTIYLGKVMAENLNMGNYTVYHVENGNANEMTLIPVDAEFTAHNQYKYSLDGELTLYMASFSEVAVVSEEENRWNGKRDYSWYDADATYFEIRNADQLAGFGAIVGGMANPSNDPNVLTEAIAQDSFEDKTVVLLADIDLNDDEENNDPDKIFYPIGYWNDEELYAKNQDKAVSSGFYSFDGTFDGNGNTISNFYHNTWEMKGDHNWYDATLQHYRDGMGLFGIVYGGTVKNLIVKNFSSDGEITTTGVIAAYADSGNGKSATFENISIFNCNPRVYNIGNGGIVGCAGWYSRSDETASGNPVIFRNITVDQTNKISALWGTYDVSCGGILGQYYPDSSCGLKFENCHVAAIIDVNNDVCANYQYYWYRYSGMLMGTVRANKTEGGYTVADTTGIEVTGCTYTYGSWNEYWYCELVKNSSASYTHDYQFGRLTNINDISEIKSGETWLKEGNFALVSTDRKSVECYHIFKDSNGNLYRHFHDVADESNPNIYEDFDLNGDGELNDLKEDRQRYYLPFGQVLNGLGYGVKPTYTMEGFTLVEDGTVISGEKFEQKTDAVLTYTPGQTIKLSDLVDLAVDESKLSQSSLYAAASPVDDTGKVSITYKRYEEAWEDNYIIISDDAEGAIKLVLTDYFYCTPTVIYLNPEQAAEKFTANSVSAQTAYTQITLGTLFGLVDGATIGDVTATVTDPNGNETTVSGTSTDWASQPINLTKDGTWTVVIKDDDAYCAVTTVTFTVNKADKFVKKFDKDFLYRVGNENSFNIGYIFGEKETAIALDSSSVEVEITKVDGDVTWTATPNTTTWTSGTLDFDDTGVVKVTISAEAVNDCVLYLEVVDAKNATSAESTIQKDGNGNITYAGNIALINNCSSSGFTVSDGYAFYGNGFTVSCAGKGTYLNVGGMYRGYVNVESGGVLDNVQVICDIYPAALLYSSEAKNYKDEDASTDTSTRNMYQLSAIAVTGNGSKVWNSYVYGGRTNIYVGDGNVTIEDTTTENGTLANIQLKGNDVSTVILRDVTTIQNKVVSTYDSAKTMLGCGVLVGSPESTSNPEVVIQNSWNSYNWVTAADANAVSSDYAKEIINTAVTSDAYVHTNQAGTDTANLALIVLNNLSVTIDDQRADEVKNGYLQSSISVKVKDPTSGIAGTVTGQVYSVANNTGDPDVVAPAYASSGNAPYKPDAVKDNTVTGAYDANDGSEDTRYCYWDGDLLKLMYKENETAFVLPVQDLVAFTKHGYTLTADAVVTKNGTAVAQVNGKVTFTDAGTYTITYTIEENYNYDKNGNQIADRVQWIFSYDVEVSLLKNAGKDAEINVASTSFYGSYGKTSNMFDPDFHYCIPFMTDVTITDYAEDGVTASTFDATKNIINIAVEGDKSSGTVTFTYLDGRVLVVTVSGHSVGLGSSGNTISVKSYNNQLWICTDGVSNNATTGTWKVTSYKFTGNNGKTVEYTTTRTCNFDSASTTNSPQTSWSSYASPSVDSIKYTITYDANGGSCTKAQAFTTASSTTVTLPTPTRSGYMCVGWYTAASGGTRVGGAGDSYEPSASVTLYAQWGKPSVVTYNANGGSCGTASEKYTGTALTLPTPTRDGYWFTGWYTAASGGTRVGGAGAAYQATGDITLYAQWSLVYTVTYNANGGSVSPTSAEYKGTALTLPMPTRDGYAFNGWYTAASGGTKVEGAYTPTANITLYAQWKEPATVTYNANGGSCSTSSATFTGTALTLPTPTRSGYNFTGWYTAASGGTKVDSPYEPTANITLYAQWTGCVVTYNANNGSCSTSTQTYAGTALTLPTATRSNYTFNGWYTAASGGTKIGDAGASYTPTADITLYAQWTYSGGCVTPDTLVTLADGTQKEIQYVTYEDQLLVWDFFEGKYTTASSSIIKNHGYDTYEIMKLMFADGTEVKTINGHGFFDAETREYVILDRDNVADYIGHSFIKQDGQGTATAELLDYEIYTEYTESWSILTAEHYNCILEGMWTLTPAEVEGSPDYLMPFEINDDLKYDEKAMQADIEKYGLYTYEEFADVLTYEQFAALNLQYFKVSVGKGYIKYEDILFLIDLHMN